ncbi:hypothetical protein ACHAWF_011617 [Thalassiosira exigua]
MMTPSVLRFKFDDFASLPSEPGDCVYSEELTDSHGNGWRIQIEPGGTHEDNETSADRDPWIGFFLENMGTSPYVIRCTIVLRDSLGKAFTTFNFDPKIYQTNDEYGSWGGEVVNRSDVLDDDNNILSGGALVVDALLQYHPTEKSPSPSSSLARNILQLLDNEKSADVMFWVGGESIAAHKLILQMNSPALFDFCAKHTSGSPIHINDITPQTFRTVLRYIYGEEIPDTDTILTHGRDILDAANRYGVVGLKVAVEAALVHSFAITYQNALDWLIFSDAKVCPLLKECALSICTACALDNLNDDDSKKLKESPRLMEDLMREVFNNANRDGRYDDGINTTVYELRKQLHEKGLDVDGNKENLISRLEESKKRAKIM